MLSRGTVFSKLIAAVSNSLVIMKILVFAHVPPPHHGQSYMVKLMLDGFGGDRLSPTPHGIECYHVNAQLSSDLTDIGEVRPSKGFRLLWYCFKAIWMRFRYGVRTLYYVPAPGKAPALIRDWMVMTICRPFFKSIILHWHAAGMVKWVESSDRRFIRWMTYRCLGRADLCIALSQSSRQEIEALRPRRIRIVPNGIPDPCPDFEHEVLHRRVSRFEARRQLVAGLSPTDKDSKTAGNRPEQLKVLYLAHCIREKGLFDAIDGVAQASARLKQAGSPIKIQLTVAGRFFNAEEEAEFRRRMDRPDLRDAEGKCIVHYAGFLSGTDKHRAFIEADCFVFPTYYRAESFGLVVVEAMAYGLPIITTRWRSIPDLLPRGYRRLVEPHAPEQIAEHLLAAILSDDCQGLRNWFVQNYRKEIHLCRLSEAIRAIEQPPDPQTNPAKILIFAHTPPPHHGQSYMVKQMLEGFGGDQRGMTRQPEKGVTCYHVNARLSRNLEDVGEARIGKLGVLSWYCLEAIWCRFRYGVTAFYYVPAPGKRSAVMRDWMVMALCRPFFSRVVFHWHAAGLGQWLTQEARGFERALTQKLLGQPSLSIIISDFNHADAEVLRSEKTTRIDYGIPDPCIDFESSLLEERHRRAICFQQTLGQTVSSTPRVPVFNVLFLANCLRTKGVFVALEAFVKFQQKVQHEAPGLRTHLRVGGAFGDAADEKEFHSMVQRANASGTVEYLGFISGAQKDAVLRQADLLCFPTFYPGENQPIVLIESLAYGLPAVTTHWRSIPDIFPPAWPGVVPIQDADATADAMWKLLSFLDHERLRARYLEHFTVEVHQRKLAAAIGGVT
jgi:glycosyltransferase involved in cell wall biosynthesis